MIYLASFQFHAAHQVATLGIITVTFWFHFLRQHCCLSLPSSPSRGQTYLLAFNSPLLFLVPFPPVASPFPLPPPAGDSAAQVARSPLLFLIPFPPVASPFPLPPPAGDSAAQVARSPRVRVLPDVLLDADVVGEAVAEEDRFVANLGRRLQVVPTHVRPSVAVEARWGSAALRRVNPRATMSSRYEGRGVRADVGRGVCADEGRGVGTDEGRGGEDGQVGVGRVETLCQVSLRPRQDRAKWRRARHRAGIREAAGSARADAAERAVGHAARHAVGRHRTDG